MSIELTVLTVLALLLLALALVYGVGFTFQFGLKRMLGNREGFGPALGWSDRCRRAHLNLLENLLPFAIVVLCARAIGVSNSMTVLGAEIFLVARLVHVASYVAGVTIIRTIAHHTGTLGTLLIAFELFAHPR
jgi:uncharacterized MAPEG superfamily protein